MLVSVRLYLVHLDSACLKSVKTSARNSVQHKKSRVLDPFLRSAPHSRTFAQMCTTVMLLDELKLQKHLNACLRKAVTHTLERFLNLKCMYTLFFFCFFFFIRTSNFGAEAERSYIFLRSEAENVLKMFLNYMVYTTCISVNQCGRAEIIKNC